MTWEEVISTKPFQDASMEQKVATYHDWINTVVAEEEKDNPYRDYILDELRRTPMDTGQGVIATTANAAAQNVLGTIPTAIAGVGAMTGSQGMEEFGRGGMEYAAEAFPTNPANPKSATLGNVLGNVGTMAFGGAGLAKGAMTLGLAEAGALNVAKAGMLGLGGAMGGVEGAQAADQAGLTGFDRQLGAMIGGAKEVGTELLPFGMGTETALARRVIGAGKPSRLINPILSEAGEEGLGQLAQNVGIRSLAADDKQPGIFEDVASSAFWGGVGGGMLGGINLTLADGTELPPSAGNDVRPVASETDITEGEVPVFHQGKLVGAKPVIQQEEFEPIADLIEELPPAASAVVESTDIAAKSLDETAKIAPEAVAATSRVAEELGFTDVADVPVDKMVDEDVITDNAPKDSAADLLERRAALDAKAKALGFKDARALNIQQQSSSSITPDEQSVMEEYAIINNELRSLNWSDAANLDEEGFGVWAKNRFTPEITTENDLNGLEELTLALQKRGDMATASKTRDTIRFKKKKDRLDSSRVAGSIPR